MALGRHPWAADRLGPPLGAIAQLGERLLCKQEVAGSIPAGSTLTGIRGLLSSRPALAVRRLSAGLEYVRAQLVA